LVEAFCRDFDEGVHLHGVWAERRAEETRTAPAPSGKRKPTIQVRKYKTLDQILGLDTGEPPAPTRDASGSLRMVDQRRKETEEERQARELLADPEAMAGFVDGILAQVGK
jgi:hypothetical protein